MKTDINNKIIVIGGSHHNMLGVVRGLGLRGLKTTVIITSDRSYSFVAKSKFVEKAFIVKEDKEEVINTLMSAIEGLKEKAVIIPTSDFAALLVDENYNKLENKCILPSINKTQGGIAEYMDKYKQYNLAQEYGIKVAKSQTIELLEDTKEIIFESKKYILKPVVSADGVKSDIRICEKKELGRILAEFKEKGYKRVLAQEYLVYDTECALVGCADSEEVIISGMMKKERIYPLGRGSTSYAHIEKTPKDEVVEKIKKLLKDIRYSGIFDIDIFIKQNELYFNEINFRNGANTFALCHGDVYLIYLWVRMALKKNTDNLRKTISQGYDFIEERAERKHLIEGNISFREYLRTRKKAKARLLYCRKDIRPSVYKIIYAIRNRITR